MTDVTAFFPGKQRGKSVLQKLSERVPHDETGKIRYVSG